MIGWFGRQITSGILYCSISRCHKWWYMKLSHVRGDCLGHQYGFDYRIYLLIVEWVDSCSNRIYIECWQVSAAVLVHLFSIASTKVSLYKGIKCMSFINLFHDCLFWLVIIRTRFQVSSFAYSWTFEIEKLSSMYLCCNFNWWIGIWEQNFIGGI